MPPKQTFGKGKRARIPNKRYSDITLGTKISNKFIENGSEKIESENESSEPSIKEEILIPPTNILKAKDKVDSPVQKKTKCVELSDPKFLKPFKYGWRRELVWRATYENKPLGDIYYYTPQGKKVRSMREVADHLKNNKDLTLDNFSYFKAPLGLNDPEKETIREAKKPNPQSPLMKKVLAKSSPKSPNLPSSMVVPENVMNSKLSSPKVSSPKVLSPKISSPKVISPKITRPKITSPKVTNPRSTKTEAKITSPKLSITRSSKAKLTSPKVSSPKILSPKQSVNEIVETPAKTRASAKVTSKVRYNITSLSLH